MLLRDTKYMCDHLIEVVAACHRDVEIALGVDFVAEAFPQFGSAAALSRYYRLIRFEHIFRVHLESKR